MPKHKYLNKKEHTHTPPREYIVCGGEVVSILKYFSPQSNTSSL